MMMIDDDGDDDDDDDGDDDDDDDDDDDADADDDDDDDDDDADDNELMDVGLVPHFRSQGSLLPPRFSSLLMELPTFPGDVALVLGSDQWAHTQWGDPQVSSIFDWEFSLKQDHPAIGGRPLFLEPPIFLRRLSHKLLSHYPIDR